MINLNTITVKDLQTAYEGKANRCACGCAGEHYVNTLSPDLEDKAQALINKFVKLEKQGKAVMLDDRTYTYQTKSKLFILEVKKDSMIENLVAQAFN